MSMTDMEFCRRGGDYCPNCRSTEVNESSSIVPSGAGSGEVIRPVFCGQCGAEWCEVYGLKGYSNLDTAYTGQETHA